MIELRRIAKTSMPVIGSKITKGKASAFSEAARRRRKRVLKTSFYNDPFLAMFPARRSIPKITKKAIQVQELEPQHEPVPVPVTEFNSVCVPPLPLVKSCDPKCKPYEVPSTAPQVAHSHRSVHPPLIDVSGGVAANVLLAKRLPEQLLRPELQDAVPEEVSQAGHGKEMMLRSLEFMRMELSRNGLKLFNAIANTVPEPMVASHSSELPELVTLSASKTVQPEYMPTHLLMVHSSEKEDKDRLHRVIAVPVHAPVLAAHCSRVPPLPRHQASAFDPIGDDDDLMRAHKRIVPLVPFSIPSPDTFPLITQFLCTQDAIQLFKALVPVAPPETQVANLSEHLANSYTSSSLVSNAMRVYGVWQNACSLGVLNPQIWQVIDVAWKGYREALLLARR